MSTNTSMAERMDRAFAEANNTVKQPTDDASAERLAEDLVTAWSVACVRHGVCPVGPQANVLARLWRTWWREGLHGLLVSRISREHLDAFTEYTS